MELSEVAAKETSALVEHVERDLAELTKRLTGAAEAERKAAVAKATAEARAAADAERKAAVDKVTAEVRTAAEAERKAAVAKAVAEARTTAEAERKAAVDKATAEARRAAEAERKAAVDKVTAEIDKVTTDARNASGALRAELAERTADIAAKTAALADARTEGDALRAALESVEALLATARTDLIESRRLNDQAEAARAEVLAARDKETAARATAETELQDLRDVVREHERARMELEAKLEGTAQRDVFAASMLDGLVSGFGTLATATTIPDILTTLVEQLAAEFPRVALFRPKANRLEGQHQIGFDLSNDITKVVMPLTLDSLLTRAATSGHLESMAGGALAEGSHVPFGGSPMCAVALPLVVQGETLGVLYADDSGSDRQDSPSERAARIKYCEAMQQHAVALLMRLTNELKTMAELRAYAGSLLNEIQQMYLADVQAEKTAAELRRRLQANVEYARSIFATRVALECPDAARLIEDEIAAALQREDSGAFGRDLQAATGQMERARAEAS
jgi:hypothetical protein